MDKFKWAPGMPGFGTKGIDGSEGTQGLSMYFTDIDPVTYASTINLRIANNHTLWSASNVDLPGGRVYMTGDLFVSSDGKVYEIDAENDTFTFKFANLNTAGYFVYSGVNSDIYNFNRYYNNNKSPKYLIDNVYADEDIAYYTAPGKVYNIYTKNYARIEYSNVENSGYNPFTIYSSSKIAGDENKSIAIVRNISTNTFRIGNLDDTNNIRNVNLIFDVASLKQTKQSVNNFTYDTTSGTILTNYEINANALFDGVFTRSPLSFYSTFSSTDLSINWNLLHFTPDNDIKADLHVYKDVSASGGTFNFASDVSQLYPFVFHDISTTGYVRLTGITEGARYKYFIKFTKNGWERCSDTQTVTASPTPFLYVNPSTLREPSGGHAAIYTRGFCVSSNVPWTASYSTNPGSFMYDLSPGSHTSVASDTSLFTGLTQNTDDGPRTGRIRIASTILGGNSPIYATIIQNGTHIPILADVSGGAVTDNSYARHIDATRPNYVTITDLPVDTVVDVCINYSIIVHNNYNDLGYNVYYDNAVQMSAPGKSTTSYSTGLLTCPDSSTRLHTGTLSLLNCGSANLPITIDLTDYAYITDGETYYFTSDINLDLFVSHHKSGTPTFTEYSRSTTQFTMTQSA